MSFPTSNALDGDSSTQSVSFPAEPRRRTAASLDPFVTSATRTPTTTEDASPSASMFTSTARLTPRQRGKKREDDHLPSLDGLARRLGNKSLERVTLEEVLDGSSCSPISFRDFQNFVTHKEYTIENLLFIIWFRSYQRRFDQLAETERNKVDVPSNKLGDGSSPFAYIKERRRTLVQRVRSESVFGIGIGRTGSGETFTGTRGTENNINLNNEGERRSSSIPLKSIFKRAGSSSTHTHTGMHEHESARPQGTESERDPASPTPSRNLTLPPTLSISVPSSAYLPEVRPADQPMREEAERAFETFLKQGAERELNVTEEMRTRCRVALEGSTHPEVFLPVYKEIYGFLEMQTLPHFLSYAQTNINFPKQVFWYGVGLTDLAISILILVLMVVLLPGRSFGWRAPRLVSVLFASFGAMQTYSAWRGFCTQVWGRTSRQLHPWELEAGDGQGVKLAEHPRRRSVDLEGGGWVDPWADSAPKSPLAVEKGSAEMDAERVSWLPTFGGPGAPDQGEDPLDPLSAGSSSGHQGSPEQAISMHSWDDHQPRLAAGYSIGDMSDISPWDEPPSGIGNSNTHLIFPVSEKEEHGEASEASTSTAVQRRQSAGLQQSKFLRRLLREKNTEVVVEPHQKPPVFGDEIVIVDERVIRLHRQVVRDILVVGAVWGIAWIAICLAIPTK